MKSETSARRETESYDQYTLPHIMSPPMSTAMSRGCAHEKPLVARRLLSFTRQNDRIARHDWVMVTTSDVTVVGRVSELVEMHKYENEHVVNVVRLLLEQVILPVFDDLGLVTVKCAYGTGHVMWVPLERAHVSYMCRDISEGVMRLRLP